MIRSRYNHPGDRPVVRFTLPSMTFQSEKDGTMIEAYLKRYRATGFLGDPQRKAAAAFGDFTGVEDYQSAMNKITALKEYFDTLPSNVRRFFGDEPGNYVSFITDPRNLDKAVEMGLVSMPPAASSQPTADAKTPQDGKTETPSTASVSGREGA